MSRREKEQPRKNIFEQKNSNVDAARRISQLQQVLDNKEADIQNLKKKLVRQLEESAHAERLQKAVFKISELASLAENIEQFYQSLHHKISQLLYGKNFYVALVNEKQTALDFVYFVDSVDKEHINKGKLFSIPLSSNSVSVYAYNLREPVLLTANDIEQLEEQKLIKRKGPKACSWLGAPLIADNMVLGIIVVQSYSNDFIFQEWHKKLFGYVSNIITTTLEIKKYRIQLELKVIERTRKLQKEIDLRKQRQWTENALVRIAGLANSTISLDNFYRELHRIISKLIYAENFYIVLHQPLSDSIQFVYYVDTIDDRTVEDLGKLSIERMENSITACLFRSGSSLLANKEEMKAILERERIKLNGPESVSWLGIPLDMDGVILGVMVLQSYREDKVYQSQDKRIMEYIAKPVATAIQRKTSQQQLESLVKERTAELAKTNQMLTVQIAEKSKVERLQSALYEIANLASGAEDMATFYKSIHSILGELFYAENFYIALLDDNKESLRFSYFVDLEDTRQLQDQTFSIENSSLSSLLFRSDKPLLINNDEFKRLLVEEGITLQGTSSVSWLGVPLKENGQSIGIMVVQSYLDDVVYEDWHKNILEYVSHQVAITLHRKRAKAKLEREVQERTSKLEREIEHRKRSQNTQSALYQVANLANQNIPLEDLFEKIHKIIAKLLYAENFCVAIRTKEVNGLEWIYIIDSKETEGAPTNTRRESFVQYVITSGSPVLTDRAGLEKIADDNQVNLAGSAAEHYLGIPLISSNGPIGAMAVQSYEEAFQYTLEDQELLNFVAQSVVSTIERRQHNQRLEEQVETRTVELTISNQLLQKEISQRIESEKLQTALFRISETPQQCVTEEELYSRLHDIVSRLMYVESFYIARVNEHEKCFDFDYVVDYMDKDTLKSIPFGCNLASYVYRQGKVVHINRDDLKALSESGEIDHSGSASVDWIGVPLISGDSIYGIMLLKSHDKSHIYGDRDVEILNFVSTHIADALKQKNADKKLQDAYKALAEKTKKAESANEAKSAFLATVSHEIRTPMNGILGMLSLISDTGLSRQQRDYVSKISTSANSLLGVINDILDFSKIEQGKLELESIEFDIRELLDNIIDIFSSRINEKALIFNIDLEPDVVLSRKGDSLRLSQILINLVGNAIKFTEKGYVHITVKEPKKDRLLFMVEDSGVGIVPDMRRKIFSSFTQADDTTTRKFGGSGLGLSICQQLVSMMDGWIDVSGDFGKGSCFSFEVSVGHNIAKPCQVAELNCIKLLLVSDQQFQIQCWQNFCNKYEIPLLIKSSAELLGRQQKNEDLSGLTTHIFIDNNAEERINFDLLKTVRSLVGFDIPCFVLTQLSSDLPEIMNLSDDVHLIPKPTRMSVVLGLLVNDYDKQKIVNPDKIRDDNIRHKIVGQSILIAEDNSINQQVAKEILENAGANVTIVENGQYAVDACSSYQFDMILMDMQMPVMDGYQASGQIRKIYSMEQVPIIAMTANVMKGDKDKCLKYGMNDYIGKPINKAQFFCIIEQYLTGKNTIELPKTEKTDDDSDRSDIVKLPGFDILELASKLDSMDLAKELVDVFYHTHDKDQHKINQLIAANRLAEAQKIVHKLKGSAGDLGLTELHSESEVVDNILKRDLKPDQQEITKMVDVLSRHLQQFKEIIEENKTDFKVLWQNVD